MIRLPFRTAAAGLALLALTAGAASAQTAPLSEDERTAIEGVVRDYLLAHPEIITEALTVLQAREEEAERERQRAQIISLQDQIFADPDSPVMGNPDGDITVVEFFDYQCSYCKRMLENVFRLTEENGDIRVVFKEFPILGPESLVAAKAALAAQQQDPESYPDFHNALMGHRGQLSQDVIFRVAESVGLDVDQLRQDMESEAVAQELADNMRLADALGVNGTPAFVIGEQVVPGAMSWEDLEALIAAERAS